MGKLKRIRERSGYEKLERFDQEKEKGMKTWREQFKNNLQKEDKKLINKETETERKQEPQLSVNKIPQFKENEETGDQEEQKLQVI